MSTTPKDIRIDRVRLTQRGAKGTYHAEFSFNGKHCRKSLKTANLKIAQQRARTLNAELALGQFREAAQRWSITDSIAAYLEHGASVGKAEGTISVYRGNLNAYHRWCETRGVRAMQQISITDFEKYLFELRRSRDPITVHNHAIVIKQWVKWASIRGHLNDHVLRLCSLKKPPRKPRFVPSLHDVWAIIKNAPEETRLPLAVLATTGMRCGELRHLQVEDIDFGTGWISIVSRAGRETKTRASRRVPLHPMLHGLLKQAQLPHSGFVFPRPPGHTDAEGHDSLDTIALNRQLRGIAIRLGFPAGVKQCGMTLHTFRRFFETHSVNSGVPQRCIDAWLGHTSDRSMGAVYYSLTDTQSAAFMRQLNFDRPAVQPEPNG